MADTPETVLEQAGENMEKALVALDRNFGRVRTGRASLTLLDGIRVDYYGTPTPLNQVASLSIPEPRLIIVQPWESNLMSAIEKAILSSNMDLNPSSDGKVIRIPIPKLSEERRKDLVKVVKSMTEDARVAVRNSRREANSLLEKLEKDKVIGEDELRTLKDDVQKITDGFIKKADAVQVTKEAEILEV